MREVVKELAEAVYLEGGSESAWPEWDRCYPGARVGTSDETRFAAQISLRNDDAIDYESEVEFGLVDVSDEERLTALLDIYIFTVPAGSKVVERITSGSPVLKDRVLVSSDADVVLCGSILMIQATP